ncbi:MAG: DNA-binding response regulator [Spirochaetales bacterium]|nr:DNA-binding response regulator [Spirochaetales bacterium]
MKAKVLIVEDEKELAELVQMYLNNDGIESEIAYSAENGIERLCRSQYDLMVLDINLPGMDGFELLQQIRPKFALPIIIVSAREADEDVIMGLSAGADEFVTKPFTPRVLVARIRALLRRSRADARQMLEFGPFLLDADGYYLVRDDRRITMSSKEFEVLRHLALNAGRAMTPHQIYEEVWGNQYGDSTTVAVYIRRIRQKIENEPRNPMYIQTIHGRGYRFNPDSLVYRG